MEKPDYVDISISYSGLEMSDYLGNTFFVQGKSPSIYRFDREGGYSRIGCAIVWRTGIQAD